jgi:hypothetical protein
MTAQTTLETHFDELRMGEIDHGWKKLAIKGERNFRLK